MDMYIDVLSTQDINKAVITHCGGTGPADLVTAGPIFSPNFPASFYHHMCAEHKKSRSCAR